jgi:diguanylate cyclase (GGDEF)-like protein
MSTPTIDFATIGQALDLDLLRAIAFGGKRSVEIGLLLDSQKGSEPDYQALALAVADMSVSAEEARRSFEALSQHQAQLGQALGREVGLKAAALDLLENVERSLKLEESVQQPTYFQLEQMAYRDQLTGLRNFRFFKDRFHEEVQRAKRYRHQLSLLMLDIDYFKKFNDTHGHQAGNVALRHLATLLAESARETDFVARYGGEEFALVLTETTKRMALELAERLCHNIESSSVKLDNGEEYRITVSLGVATLPRDAWTQETLLEAADQALYASKKMGRNRVSAFQPKDSAVFRYHPEAGAEVRQVSVVGSFNGWDPQADVMHLEQDGSYHATVPLASGTYEYKFVLNLTHWISDPAAGDYISDGYGGQNSVAQVKKA